MGQQEDIKTDVDKIMADLEEHLSKGDKEACASAIDEAIAKLESLKECLSG